MKIKIDTSGLKESKWYEYLIRFLFGGIVTVLAGIIAKRYGPEIGGLFLAFPAILTASATLIEKHEKEKKQDAGMKGTMRGKLAAGVDAIGASMGALGLAAFALVIWLKLLDYRTAVALTIATIAWFFTAVLVWKLRQVVGRRIKARSSVSGVHSGAALRRNRS
jgi:uncharacterized membrane protein YfcA